MVRKKPSAAGAEFERDVKPWMQILWPRADRNGIGFVGADFRETEEYAIECKNHSRLELSTWMTQTVQNAIKEKRKYPVLIHKRRRYGTADAYVTMRLEDWVKDHAELMGIEPDSWPNEVSEGATNPPEDLD